MKGIKKQNEPIDFSIFKDIVLEGKNPQQYNYEALLNSPENKIWVRNINGSFLDKPTMREHLLKEQGYLCCYCCRRVSNDSAMVVEHFKPKSDYKEYSFNWVNLLLSCSGKSSIDNRVFCHCDENKDNKYSDDLISPLETEDGEFVCEKLFSYNIKDGTILHQQNDRAEYTINLLNLNAETLKIERAKAVDILFENNEIIDFSDKEVMAIFNSYSSMDSNGMFEENCQVVLFFIKAYFKIL